MGSATRTLDVGIYYATRALTPRHPGHRAVFAEPQPNA
jgi:hypothetical protein